MLQIQQNVYISINFHTPTHPYNTQLTKLAYCIMQSYLLDFNSKLSYTPNNPISTTQSIKRPPPTPPPTLHCYSPRGCTGPRTVPSILFGPYPNRYSPLAV